MDVLKETSNSIRKDSDRIIYADKNVQFTYGELQAVATSYGLGAFKKDPQLERGGLSNYNFRMVTDKGEFNVRARKGEPSAYELKRKNLEYEVTDHLQKEGFYLATPVFKSTLFGQRPLTLEGKTYDVYERLPGETQDVSPVGRKEVIEAVARYHKAIQDLPKRDVMPLRTAYDESGWLGQRLEAIKAKVQAPQTALDSAMQGHIPFVIDAYHALRTGAKPNPASVVVHGDINPGNLLYENGVLTGLIDFGNVRWDTKENDLAKLTHGGPKQVTELVTSYRAHNPLSEQEAANILPERMISLIHGIRWLYEDMVRAPEAKATILDNHIKRLRETRKYWDEQKK